MKINSNFILQSMVIYLILFALDRINICNTSAYFIEYIYRKYSLYSRNEKMIEI